MTVSCSVGDVVTLLDAVVDGSNYKFFGISVSIGTIQTYCNMSLNFYSSLIDDGTLVSKSTVCGELSTLRAGADVLKVVRGKLLSHPSYSIDGVMINKAQYISIINDLVKDLNERIEQYLRTVQPIGEITDVEQPDYSEDSAFTG